MLTEAKPYSTFFDERTKFKKVPKRYPFSSDRQHNRYARQIENGQIDLSQIAASAQALKEEVLKRKNSQ